MDLQQQLNPLQEDTTGQDPNLQDQAPAVDPLIQEMQQQQEEEQKEQVKKILGALVNRAYDEERPTRELMIRRYKKLNLMWTGNQYAVWDESAGDYRTLDQLGEVLDELEIDPAAYNRPVNVFRAWGESIVGALTTGTPRTKFMPRSMSSADDISTARGFESISELIDQHNNPKEKLAKAVTNIYKQGMCAAYNYVHEDKKYGVVKQDVYGPGNFVDISQNCSGCGGPVPDSPDQFGVPHNPEIHDNLTQLDDLSAETMETFECETCQAPSTAQQNISAPYQQPTVIGQQEAAKRRVLIEIYDALSVIIPQNSSSQKDVGFLICDVEIHEALAKALYPEIRDKIHGSMSAVNTYDRWARASTEYGGGNASYLVTYRRAWLRPWYYEQIDDEEERNLVKAVYPRGVRVVMIDDIPAECTEEDLDDCWTVSYNPLNNRVYDYSVGMGAAPIQEMFSEMINLVLMTIQYGIPETFADPEVVSFQKYKKVAASPGLMIPAKAVPGKSMGDAFYQLSPATLPKDAVEFLARLEQYGQLVTGAFPSIFGGNMQGGSGTYGEYETSKNQALQRLSLLWFMTISMWHSCKLKACKMYRDAMLEDESFSKTVGTSQIEVFIKQSELNGHVAETMPETTEEFPVSWSQQRDSVMKLIEQKVEPFMNMIALPENSTFLQQMLGLDNLYVPGNDDRTKQLKEIAELLQGQPIMPGLDDTGNPVLDETGQPAKPEPTIPVDPTVDKHDIEAEVCSSFLRSSIGQYMKDVNPGGYANIVAHMEQHQQNIQQTPGNEQPPKTQINYKDLQPDGQVQLAAQAGLTIQPPPVIIPTSGNGGSGSLPNKNMSNNGGAGA